MRTSRVWSRGFALIDAGVTVGFCAALIAVGMVAAGNTRRSAGLAGSMANLKRIGELTGTYAADFDDQLWTFTWSPGNCPSQYADLQNAGDAPQAIANQAVDIVRRRFDESQPRLTDRLAAPWLSTLALVDYLEESLPAEWAVSPGDKVRLAWQADPHNPPDLNEQGGDAWSTLFSIFGSSYLLMPAYFAPDEADSGSGRDTISQYSGHHDLYHLPNNLIFGQRRASEIASPSRKVHMAERASFFFGPRPAYFLYAESRVPLLMADGSASVRRTADANASFSPNVPNDMLRVTTTRYYPNPIYEPPALGGGAYETIDDCTYKWTRRGLRGVDFDGERVE